jgi:hypothetical protein
MQSVFTQLILHYIDLICQFFQAASGRRAQIHALEVPHVFFAFLDELLPRNESLVTEKNIEHYTFRRKHKGIKNGFCKHVIKQTVLMGCTRGSLVETLPSLPRDLPSFVELLLLIGAGTRGVPGGMSNNSDIFLFSAAVKVFEESRFQVVPRPWVSRSRSSRQQIT